MLAFAPMTEILTPSPHVHDDGSELESRHRPHIVGKFTDPDFTVNGKPRAKIALRRLETLWINTGTLCNIECVNCYIESSPQNDRLAYFQLDDAKRLFEEANKLDLGTRLIGFTGGEPFMNPDMTAMIREALASGFDVLVLTNAMQPMQRPAVRQDLLDIHKIYGDRLTIRVSLDHFSKALHDTERGAGAWDQAVCGIDWLAQHGFQISLAGRTCWNETEDASRQGYAKLCAERGYDLDANDPSRVLLFPEMDADRDVAEITTDCWDILGVDPDDIMCATSRMVVKRKGDPAPSVLPCTLLPYDEAFHMGSDLQEAAQADSGMFDNGQVKLNHHYCAKFCVLGGGSCTGGAGDD